MTKTRILPLLPLRDIVVFPHRVSPLFVGREKSVRALEEAMRGDKEIVLATQKDVHSVGVIATVLQLLKLPDGTVKVLVEGKQRVKLEGFDATEPMFTVRVSEIAEIDPDTAEAKALSRTAIEQFENYVKLNRKIPPEIMAGLGQLPTASQVADVIAGTTRNHLHAQAL
jgi:ATP-dependent Lon protease